jgi:hypothetical protein
VLPQVAHSIAEVIGDPKVVSFILTAERIIISEEREMRDARTHTTSVGLASPKAISMRGCKQCSQISNQTFISPNF